MARAIDVRGLTKTYTLRSGDTIEAVRGVDLHVDEGEILAFLGSNGAGKTTTIEILEGFRDRTGGDVTVLGQDPATAPLSWREDIGVVLQESEPSPELTVEEVMTQYASYYRAPRSIDEILELVGLADHRMQRNKVLSGGQKRRLDLALALIGDPKLVFLDEPTTGFDPSARRDAWGMIERLRELGTTVLLTTHYMDEAEQLSDRIVVISGGRIIAEGTADALADQVQLKTRVSWDPGEVPVSAVPDVLRSDLEEGDDVVRIETDDVTAIVHALSSWAADNGSALRSLGVVRPNLEDTFLRLTDTDEADDRGNQPDSSSSTGGGE
ncbi:MAG: ABC transporter ATP-binding protein [Actinomycetota bacterium]